MKLATITTIVISAVIIIIAGAANGVMDTLTFHYQGSCFASLSPELQGYWNPKLSWCNKYVSCDNHAARFIGSTTVFVFITDGWHLMKAIYSTFLLIGSPLMFASLLSLFKADKYKKKPHIVLPLFIVSAVIICKALVSIGFHLTYSILLPCP